MESRGGWATAVIAVGLVMAGCGEVRDGGPADRLTEEPEAVPTDDPGSWRAVADAPLPSREAPLTVAVDGRILVVGGSDADPCPPNAACVPTGEVPLSDGALYDPATDTWTPVATTPTPISAGTEHVAVVDGIVYVLATSFGEESGTPLTFLSYDVAADLWSTLTPPDTAQGCSLTVAGDTVIAYPTSHGAGDGGGGARDPIPADVAYDAAADTWNALPPDPLAPSFDRRMDGFDDQLFLFSSDLAPDPGAVPPVVRVATLDVETGRWATLPDGDLVSSFGLQRVGDQIVSAVDGMAGGDALNTWGRDVPYSGVFDPATGEWSRLPDRPEMGEATGSMAVGDAAGERTLVSGPWVLDVPTLNWTAVPPIGPEDDVTQGRSVAVVDGADGPAVFVWVGVSWPDGWHRDARLSDQGWIWEVPTG